MKVPGGGPGPGPVVPSPKIGDRCLVLAIGRGRLRSHPLVCVFSCCFRRSGGRGMVRGGGLWIFGALLGFWVSIFFGFVCVWNLRFRRVEVSRDSNIWCVLFFFCIVDMCFHCVNLHCHKRFTLTFSVFFKRCFVCLFIALLCIAPSTLKFGICYSLLITIDHEQKQILAIKKITLNTLIEFFWNVSILKCHFEWSFQFELWVFLSTYCINTWLNIWVIVLCLSQFVDVEFLSGSSSRSRSSVKLTSSSF